MSVWTDAVAALSMTPVGWYKFDDSSGTTLNDSSSNNLDGSYASSWTKSLPTLVPGDGSGTAASLDAAAAYAASGASVQSETFSVAFTYKGTDTSTGSVVFTRGSTGSSQSRMTVASGSINLQYAGVASAMTWSGGPAALSNNEEHFVIVRMQNNLQSMIVDGVVVATATAAKNNTQLGTVFLGGNSASSLAGIYDEWLLWDGYLSDADAADLWDAWQGGPAAPEVTADLSGSGSLSATVSAVAVRTGAFAGSGALAAVVAPVAVVAAAFTGSGDLTASAAPVATTSAAFSGSGELSAQVATADSAQVSADFSGAGTFAAAVLSVHAIDASLSGAGALSAPTEAVYAVDAAFSGSGSFTATLGADSPFEGFVSLYDSTEINGAGHLVETGADPSMLFILPAIVLDPTTTYTVTVDFINAVGDSRISLYSSLGPTQTDADASNWFELANYSEGFGTPPGTLGETGPFEFTIGPGIADWAAAVTAGEPYVIFQLNNMEVTSISVVDASTPPEPIGSDASNDAHKLTLGGWGVVEWEPEIVPAPFTGVRHSVISAIAYGPVTMQGTQPVFTYSEADRPRLRQRILLGGQDWTYPRGIPTPDVEYELADLLLYGPASLDLPAYVAPWETGTDATERASEGRRVKVQLVDDFTDPENPTVEATVYKGFVMNPGVSGRNLTLELGGEAQGRLALRDSHVLFRDVLDISRLLWRELTDVGVRYLPRLGEPGIGIRSLNFGGTSKLEKVEELLARAVKKDGTQRVVMPDEQGVYRITDKDTVTVHYSVFVDDAFTVADLSSDIAEKPNAIYATAIAPSGMRIDGAAVPGLITTPAPDYPMDSGNAFGVGTTNEDTDTGDGISVMVNRLGAVGLLDIRDTPGGFDEDVEDALKKLQRQARTTGPVGQMNPALWAALWDLDETGRSGRWSSIQPTAEHASVQRYLRSASGAVIGLNPDYDADAIQVDESIDMGTGFRERQVQNWAETRVHAPDAKVWYGTITVNLGAVLAGQVNVGATITAADLVDARLVRPGQNLWVPNFDGGTLFGVSGVQVRGDSVAFTVDTRHRPAREVWERLQVRRETRNDPARRMLGNRQSTERKDAVRGFISWGGIVDRDVPLEAGWNVVEVVLGDHGTISWLDLTVQTVTSDGGSISIEGHEYALALFGKPITAARLNELVPDPLAENGDRPFRRRATRKTLNEHGFLVAFGTQDEPCGYGSDIKSDDAPLTGRFVDDAGVTYDCENYVARFAIYVRPGADGAKLLAGRIAWPVLEGGI